MKTRLKLFETFENNKLCLLKYGELDMVKWLYGKILINAPKIVSINRASNNVWAKPSIIIIYEHIIPTHEIQHSTQKKYNTII